MNAATKTQDPSDLAVWLAQRGTPAQEIADYLQIDHPGITAATVQGYIDAGYTEAGKKELSK